MKLSNPLLISSCSRVKVTPSRSNTRLPENAARCFHSSARRSAPRDYYQDLEVSPAATKSEIKAKFYELSKKYHPDVAKDDKSRDRFHLVRRAYEELYNDAKRSELDRRLGARHPQQPAPSFVRTRSTSFSNRWRTPPPSQGPRYPYTPPHARTQEAYQQRQQQQQQSRQQDSTHTGHDPQQGHQQQHRPHDHMFETHRMHKYQYYRPPPGEPTPGSYTWSAHDPFSSPWVQRATGKRATGSGSSSGAETSGDAPPGPGSGRPYGQNPYASDPAGGGVSGGRTSARDRKQTAHDEVARASPFGRMFAALGAATLIMGLAQWGSHS